MRFTSQDLVEPRGTTLHTHECKAADKYQGVMPPEMLYLKFDVNDAELYGILPLALGF